MEEQRLTTIDGEEIGLIAGSNGWPWLNGQRVGAITFPEGGQELIGLLAGGQIYIVRFAEYCQVLGISPHYAAHSAEAGARRS